MSTRARKSLYLTDTPIGKLRRSSAICLATGILLKGRDENYSTVKTKACILRVWWKNGRVPVVPGKSVRFIGRLATINNGDRLRIYDAVQILGYNLDKLDIEEY